MTTTLSEATIETFESPSEPTVSDAGGFDAYVAARWGSLWRSAWLLTGDAQRAEDLVQTALGKCWPHWERVNSNGSFDAYVRRAIFTTYLAWWRKRSWGETPILATEPVVATDPDQSTRTDLLAAMGGLPRGQRAVVVLRYFEDRTESETARLLGCTVGTVKSQHARAIRALRASGQFEDGDPR